jgi:hypothetical protein
MATKKSRDDASDKRVIVAALRTAIEAYETNEKTFRQVQEELANGREVPMFVRGEAGAKAARKLADAAYLQAEEAKALLATMEGDDEAGDE